MAETTKKTLQEAFLDGSRALAEGRGAEAVGQFEAVVGSGFTSADLERNYGRALVETGQVGNGIAHLTNGVALERFNPEIRRDLKMGQGKVDANLGQPLSHPAEWGWRIASYARPRELFTLSALSVGIALAFALLGTRTKRPFIFFILLAVIGAGVGGFASLGRSIDVVLGATELRSAPLESAEALQTLPDGTRLRVLRKSGAFAEVERPGSFRGWVVREKLRASPF